MEGGVEAPVFYSAIEPKYEFSAPQYFDFSYEETQEDIDLAESWFKSAIPYEASRKSLSFAFISAEQPVLNRWDFEYCLHNNNWFFWSCGSHLRTSKVIVQLEIWSWSTFLVQVQSHVCAEVLSNTRWRFKGTPWTPYWLVDSLNGRPCSSRFKDQVSCRAIYSRR